MIDCYAKQVQLHYLTNDISISLWDLKQYVKSLLISNYKTMVSKSLKACNSLENVRNTIVSLHCPYLFAYWLISYSFASSLSPANLPCRRFTVFSYHQFCTLFERSFCQNWRFIHLKFILINEILRDNQTQINNIFIFKLLTLFGLIKNYTNKMPCLVEFKNQYLSTY